MPHGVGGAMKGERTMSRGKYDFSPDYLFEISWEVCNKVGGIHTVLSTKASSLQEHFAGRYLVIGPDVWREEGENPEFEEDTSLMARWVAKARMEGLRVRVGRWRIPSRPVAILVDFTPFISRKDEIFTDLWQTYQLDSLAGAWDYIEPALFGYAAGKVVESIVRNELTMAHRLVAQFHEWMTGGGLLYLRRALPQVGLVFTTHATTLGRSLAGNGVPLYAELPRVNAEARAREFNVVSKQSLEKVSALQSDVFTTVSEITAAECLQFHGRPVDLVTPNGFEPDFVPEGDAFEQHRSEARALLREVSSCVLGQELHEDALLIGTSGRYEFFNKGLDVFIDALGALNKDDALQREVVAFLLIPAGNQGPRAELLAGHRGRGVLTCDQNAPYGCRHLTHALQDPGIDPIMHRLQNCGLRNSPEDKVKVIFVPCYLNGADGVFNLPYYDLLVGLDLTVFCSYYEPWGYTPLESLAFRVPTVMTTLSGFGLWVSNKYQGAVQKGVTVLHRDDGNRDEVVQGVHGRMLQYSLLPSEQVAQSREEALRVSRGALWDELVDSYFSAYDMALRKVQSRADSFSPILPAAVLQDIDLRPAGGSTPSWSRIMVQKNIPDSLKGLEELARNMWWCWQPEASALFESISPELWAECEDNPIMLLDRVSYLRLHELEEDRDFVKRYERVLNSYRAYVSQRKEATPPSIGYFSMEYGLHSSLKLYSGGLGVLAGDYLKEASDRNIRLVAMGLFYRYGYFTQRISMSGEQQELYNHQNFTQTPAVPALDGNGNWVTVEVAFPGRSVKVRVWVVQVGRVPLYLLDTDFEANGEQDRSITHYLYGGDQENRLKQEIILGVGGLRALAALGHAVELVHLNEGHAAFVVLERLRQLMVGENLSFDEASELVRASSLFTTHTPVPAGHDAFPESLIRTYMPHYPSRYGISWEHFMAFGRMNPRNSGEKFSMSHLAANFSTGINGVSQLHGAVSQQMFAGLWPGYFANENHVGYVTNGVHFPTWIAPDWRRILVNESKDAALPMWQAVDDLPDAQVWSMRNGLRQRLIDHIIDELGAPEMYNLYGPRHLMEIKEHLNRNALTLGFARRFATYKRAHLLLTDLDRLAEILNDPERPVQLLFAGKAHPHDGAGQDLIRRIFEVSKDPRFMGRLLFLPNYDMELAHLLVQGVDVWINTPTRPQEASGTSGMKVVMNGGLHLSVLDGWWVEGYREGAGWALDQDRVYADQRAQDELDAETLYAILEDQVVTSFYDRDADGIPSDWIRRVKRSMVDIAPRFTTTRMLHDYQERFYHPLYERKQQLVASGMEGLRSLCEWKRMMLRDWPSLGVIRVEGIGTGTENVYTGKVYHGYVVLDLGKVPVDSLGVELVIAELSPGNDGVSVSRCLQYKLEDREGSRATYRVEFTVEDPGAYEVAIRLYAKHPLLHNRVEFNLVRWI